MRVGRILGGLVVLGLVGLGVFWFLTAPSTLDASVLKADYKPDLANGETMFTVGGCVSCHKTPGQADRLKLGGGLGLASPFGTFYAPNISSDATNGIGLLVGSPPGTNTRPGTTAMTSKSPLSPREPKALQNIVIMRCTMIAD